MRENEISCIVCVSVLERARIIKRGRVRVCYVCMIVIQRKSVKDTEREREEEREKGRERERQRGGERKRRRER